MSLSIEVRISRYIEHICLVCQPRQPNRFTWSGQPLCGHLICAVYGGGVASSALALVGVP